MSIYNYINVQIYIYIANDLVLVTTLLLNIIHVVEEIEGLMYGF